MIEPERGDQPSYGRLPTNIEEFYAVRVELYAESIKGGAPARREMKRSDAPRAHVYTAVVSAARPAAEYTARAIPHFEGVAIPLEEGRILWQR